MALGKREQALSYDPQNGFLQKKDLSSIATSDDSISFSSAKDKSILRQGNDAFHGYNVNRIFAERKLEL